MYQFPAINYLYLVAALAAVTLAIVTYRRSGSSSARLWVGLMLGFVLWTTGELIANSGTTLAWQKGWQRLVYLGVIVSVTSWLLFAIDYAGKRHWLTLPVISLILIVPLTSLVMVMTMDMHTLLYREAGLLERGGVYVLELDYGTGFWFQILACSYLYTLLGSALLISGAFRRPRVYRMQVLLIGCAGLLPFVPNVLYVSGVDIAGGFDPTSLFFVLSAILVTLAMQHYQFLVLSPIARDLVFEHVDIAIVITSPDDQIIDANPAFLTSTGQALNEVIGLPLDAVLDRGFDGYSRAGDRAKWRGRLVSHNDARLFDIACVEITGAGSDVVGNLVMLHDVTLVQQALDEINRLAGNDIGKSRWRDSTLQLDLLADGKSSV